MNNHFAYVAPGMCNQSGVNADVKNNSQKEWEEQSQLVL